MPWSESLPQFSVAGTLLTVLLLLFAAVGEPLLGRKAFAWLSRRRDGHTRALTLLHAVTMGVHALWGLAVLGVLLLSPGLTAADLGLRLPHAWGPIAGGAAGGLVALAVLWILVNGFPGGAGRSGGGRGRRAQRHRGRRTPAPLVLPEPERDRGLLVPRTGAERAVAAGVAVTGGVFAELLYRGLFITLVASMGAPLWAAAVLSVVLFSLAHLYQGWWGLVSAGTSGALFTVLYLGTGSLWVPILVHVALDLRSLVFPPADLRRAREHEDDPVDADEYWEEYEDGPSDEYGADHDDGHPGGSATGRTPETGEPGYGYPSYAAPDREAPSWSGAGEPGHGYPSYAAPDPTAAYGGPSHETFQDAPVLPPGQGRDPGHGLHGPPAPEGAPGAGPDGQGHPGRHMYPDEWIDYRYGEQGPDTGYRD